LARAGGKAFEHLRAALGSLAFGEAFGEGFDRGGEAGRQVKAGIAPAVLGAGVEVGVKDGCCCLDFGGARLFARFLDRVIAGLGGWELGLAFSFSSSFTLYPLGAWCSWATASLADTRLSGCQATRVLVRKRQRRKASGPAKCFG
jgi:hypothetical protein